MYVFRLFMNLRLQLSFSPSFYSSSGNFTSKNNNWMKALICINLHFLLAAFSTILQHFLIVRMIGVASHCYFFYAIGCKYIHHKPLLERQNGELNKERKKWVDLGKFERENGIARTFESHSAYWHKSCGNRQNQIKTKLDHIFKRKLSWPMKQRTKYFPKYFLDNKNVPVCSF